jgi:acyl-coenzyme A synthetase/AMP-(fatty) acid ligase
MRAALSAIAYGLNHGLDYGVIEDHRLSDEVAARFAQNAVTLVEYASGKTLGEDIDAGPAREAGRVTVLTSGTTGLLKLIAHSWKTLNTFDRVSDLPDNTWFLPYQIGSYAWYQMVSLGLFVPGQTLICGDFNDLMGSFEAALQRDAVSAISSTPTFWRLALMAVDAKTLDTAALRSVSMGGEIVDQAIIDEIRRLFPAATVRHIYASSEAGAAIVVSDGKAGFPASLTTKQGSTIRVKVEEDRLYIQSPYSNKADADGWVDTGDLVELRGERYFFCGRAGNTMINVGGQKAFPPDIEAYLMAHDEVIWAQVTARRAPLMGSLPVAKVVLRKGSDKSTAEQRLTEYCAVGLAEYAVPRMWDFPDEIPIRSSLKS